jgi:hypothetical protein
MQRGTVHRSITVKGKSRRVMVERRPIEAKAPEAPPAPISAPVAARVEYLGPLAGEVAAALRERPIRFPWDWYRGGER